MAKLTNKIQRHPTRLSNRLTSPFTLCFKYKLQNGYSFSDMDSSHLKELQKFLNCVVDMTFEQVERRYRRKSDKADTFSGEQVIHYGISDTFRLHGIIENGQFMVLRIDPRHKYHH